MSRRSADASQRALAYSRMVDGLNEFRLGNKSSFVSTFGADDAAGGCSSHHAVVDLFL